MLDDVASHLSHATGIVPVADAGYVYRGKVGYSDCEVSVSIEAWQGAFYFRIAVVHTRSTGLRKIRVVKWPYSREDPGDLDGVIADLATVEGALAGASLADTRSGFGRFFDKLTGRTYNGCHVFTTPLGGEHETVVTAQVATSGKQLVVTLTEPPPRRSFIMAHIPHEAFAALHAAAQGLSRRLRHETA